MLYIQCILRKNNITHVAWLPSKFVILNKILKFKDVETGVWDNGWEIVYVGQAKYAQDLSELND
jgi:hypothetical protein